MTTLAKHGYVLESKFEADPDSVDLSSFDLHLSDLVYKLEAGVKPYGPNYLHELQVQGLATRLRSQEDSGVFQLERLKTYIVKLQERLGPECKEYQLFGQATAKSTVGRVDVLARLIVDGARGYEGFAPKDLRRGSGDLYLEITPLTFAVLIKPGISLSQLRLFYGSPGKCEVRSRQLYETALVRQTKPERTLSVDLKAVNVSKNAFGVAFCANPIKEPIALWKKYDRQPSAIDTWKLLTVDSNNRFRIEKDQFYILKSKERMRVPPGIAVYCRAIDETIGEMRIHYAGFVHPWFGFGREDAEGTPLIFEVRCHSLPALLHDGEVLAKLSFYRMSEDAVQPKNQSYSNQELQLSKFFGEELPGNLEVDPEGRLKEVESK